MNNQLLKCPICKKILLNKDVFPFCSLRCKEVDLYKWFNHDYAIPTVIFDDDIDEWIEDSRNGNNELPKDIRDD